MQHATGTFAVTITPEAGAEAAGGQLPTARMALHKSFSGGMKGEAEGVMLSAGRPTPGQSASYVALDQFSGSVDGRTGGFVLLHRGSIDRKGTSDLSIVIAPGSGTGALEGISGTLSIEVVDGAHRYDLAYQLPAD